MMVLVFFASIGYFRSNLMDQDHFTDNEIDSNTAGDDEDVQVSEAGQRRTIKNLELKLENGTSAHLADFKNRVVILSFWASDCGPCLEELPTFAKLSQTFGKDKLVVIPVNIEDDESLDKNFVAAFWKKNNFSFPSYFDTKQINAQLMDIQVIPTNYVLDKQGRIAFSSFGYNNWSSVKARDLIKSLVEEI
ncbi:MAG: hypothetical protein A4S09_02745 [Proteobacteria bacterium SG_bin7]|nr:MAG: hypothetical protein A4S09_02745 [Proteobacteria bacterium SG_bin7]